MTQPKPDLSTQAFASQKKWETWLEKQHAKSGGIWLKLAKKDSGIPSVTYDEAVESALCYGWIDGQKKGFDDKYWLQKFTPRRPKSIWSKVNTEKVERLIKDGRMKPAGLQAVEAAKADGRWANAYYSQKDSLVPDDFQSALNRNKKAKQFFEGLKSSEKYVFLFRLQTARTGETRKKKIQQFVDMLEKKETQAFYKEKARS